MVVQTITASASPVGIVMVSPVVVAVPTTVDRAFTLAMETLVGPAERTGFCLHLHHPRGPEFGGPHAAANKALCDRYYAADSHPEEMRALVDEHHRV